MMGNGLEFLANFFHQMKQIHLQNLLESHKHKFRRLTGWAENLNMRVSKYAFCLYAPVKSKYRYRLKIDDESTHNQQQLLQRLNFYPRKTIISQSLNIDLFI